MMMDVKEWFLTWWRCASTLLAFAVLGLRMMEAQAVSWILLWVVLPVQLFGCWVASCIVGHYHRLFRLVKQSSEDVSALSEGAANMMPPTRVEILLGRDGTPSASGAAASYTSPFLRAMRLARYMSADERILRALRIAVAFHESHHAGCVEPSVLLMAEEGGGHKMILQHTSSERKRRSPHCATGASSGAVLPVVRKPPVSLTASQVIEFIENTAVVLAAEFVSSTVHIHRSAVTHQSSAAPSRTGSSSRRASTTRSTASRVHHKVAVMMQNSVYYAPLCAAVSQCSVVLNAVQFDAFLQSSGGQHNRTAHRSGADDFPVHSCSCALLNSNIANHDMMTRSISTCDAAVLVIDVQFAWLLFEPSFLRSSKRDADEKDDRLSADGERERSSSSSSSLRWTNKPRWRPLQPTRVWSDGSCSIMPVVDVPSCVKRILLWREDAPVELDKPLLDLPNGMTTSHLRAIADYNDAVCTQPRRFDVVFGDEHEVMACLWLSNTTLFHQFPTACVDALLGISPQDRGDDAAPLGVSHQSTPKHGYAKAAAASSSPPTPTAPQPPQPCRMAKAEEPRGCAVIAAGTKSQKGGKQLPTTVTPPTDASQPKTLGATFVVPSDAEMPVGELQLPPPAVPQSALPSTSFRKTPLSSTSQNGGSSRALPWNYTRRLPYVYLNKMLQAGACSSGSPTVRNRRFSSRLNNASRRISQPPSVGSLSWLMPLWAMVKAAFRVTDSYLHIFTSGTTGLPKAAKFPHLRVHAAVSLSQQLGLERRCNEQRLCYPLTPDTVNKLTVYTCLPMYHSAGGVFCVAHWLNGMEIQNRANAAQRSYLHAFLINCIGLHASPSSATAGGWMMPQGTCCEKSARMIIRVKFSASQFPLDLVTYRVTVVQYIGELLRYALTAQQQQSVHHREDNSAGVADEAEMEEGAGGEWKVPVAFGNGLRADIWDQVAVHLPIANIVEFYASTEGNVGVWNLYGEPRAVGHLPVFPYPFQAWSPIRFRYFPMKLVYMNPETNDLLRSGDGLWCKEVELGDAGELVGQVATGFDLVGMRRFDGYHDARESNKKLVRDVLRNGDVYFRSGDVLRIDARGFVTFVDRVGDTFRWKGENVSTLEVANALTNIIVPLELATAPSQAASPLSRSTRSGAAARVEEAVVYGVTVPGREGKAGMALLQLVPHMGSDFATPSSAPVASQFHKYRSPPFAAFITNELYGLLSHPANPHSLPHYAIPVFLRVRCGTQSCRQHVAPADESSSGDNEGCGAWMTGTFKYRPVQLALEGYAAAEHQPPPTRRGLPTANINRISSSTATGGGGGNIDAAATHRRSYASEWTSMTEADPENGDFYFVLCSRRRLEDGFTSRQRQLLQIPLIPPPLHSTATTPLSAKQHGGFVYMPLTAATMEEVCGGKSFSLCGW